MATAGDELPPPLRRFLDPKQRVQTGPTCEMCGVEVPEEDHRHVVALTQRSLMCTCRGCALLFLEAGAAQGKYRTVPEDFVRVDPVDLDASAWASLQIPVGVSFVVTPGEVDADPVAFYPSPGGATESELPMTSWQAILADNPLLDGVEPDVEAVLVRTDSSAEPVCYIVPVDCCYELVGALRMLWRGFDGGQEARDAVDGFFAEIDSKSRTKPGHGPPADGSMSHRQDAPSHGTDSVAAQRAAHA